MFTKEILVSVLIGLLRYVLGGVSLWLIEKGIATPEQIGLLILGLAGFLGAAIWMAKDKIKARILLLSGLAATKGTTVNALKDQVARGCAVPVATSNDAVPRAVEDNGTVKSPPGNMGAWLLPILIAGSMAATLSACGGTIKPPVITGEDQVQVRAVASKALAGIEISNIVTRDTMLMVNDLRSAAIVSPELRETIAAAVRHSSEISLTVIDQLAAATRTATVDQLVHQVAVGLTSVAEVLERQSDPRIQTAGRLLRTAIGAMVAVIGGAR